MSLPQTNAVSKMRTISPEKREWVKKDSEKLFMKNAIMRDKTKEEMFLNRIKNDRITEQNREDLISRWQNKTKNSPFAVNLVAENERITEENTIR